MLQTLPIVLAQGEAINTSGNLQMKPNKSYILCRDKKKLPKSI